MRRLLLLSLCAMAACTAGGTLASEPATTEASRSSCAIAWNSRSKATPSRTAAQVTAARVARHECYDRLVIDVGGRPPGGYSIRYADPPYTSEVNDRPLPVAGGAVLLITIRAPAYDADGLPGGPWLAMEAVVEPDEFHAAGFLTFQDLIWGGSYEGDSAFGLGVRARLPFRVTQLTGPGTHTRVVIDVAHEW
jgi:hypothetical protein